MVQRAVNYLFGFYEKCLIPCAHILNQTARRIDCNSLHMHFSWTFSCILVVGQSLSFVRLFATPWLQHTRLPSPSPSPGVCSNSCPLSRWCHPTISSSVVPFSCLQSFPVSDYFPMSRFFTSGTKVLELQASASVLPMNINNWFLSGLTSLISLLSKGLSRVFSSTTVQKQQFFSAQPALWFNSHTHTWLLEKS